MGTEIAQVLQESFRNIDCPTVCLKIDTEGDQTDAPAVCASISRPELKRHRSRGEDGLALAVFRRCALIARPGVG